MRIYHLFALLLLGTLVWACSEALTTEESDDSMGQFADDEEFQEAHNTPDSIAFEASGEMATFDTPDGETGSAYVITAEEPSNKYLFVIHEWWGLNDHIKREAERLYTELDNTTIMALDMYDGKVATTQEEAGQYMEAVSDERAQAIIKGALAKAGPEAEIATIGWCFGGGWSLRTSILAGDQGVGCVMYYGMPVQTADKLAPLEADILGIFAENDGWITPKVVNKFKNLAESTGKDIEIHFFDANHAFANPSSDAYKEAAAQEANQLARAFLREHLGT